MDASMIITPNTTFKENRRNIWFRQPPVAMSASRLLTGSLSLVLLCMTSSAFLYPTQVRRNTVSVSSSKDLSAQEALQRTAAHLERLKRQHPRRPTTDDPFTEKRERLHQQYLLQSANALKTELKARGLPRTGRKPDLASRLVEYDLQQEYGIQTKQEIEEQAEVDAVWKNRERTSTPIHSFAGLQLSEAAANALGTANFDTPSIIQAQAIPALLSGESAILHAETGSGKTLAYLLPFTEQLWQEQNDDSSGFIVVLTPSRELAAQVAGIATVLSPPGTVRLVSHATNLLSDGQKDRGELEFGGRIDDSPSRGSPRLIVGSAKSIMHSLYGDGVMPASPTSKPEAMFFLRNVRCLILDEVDRLLNVKKARKEKHKVHERPAAVVTSAVARLTLGRAQIVAASATVGRPLKRELARVLGLPAQGCPRVIRGSEEGFVQPKDSAHLGRAITVPTTVRNYVTAVDASTTGKLLTSAFFVIKSLENRPRRILLVLTRGCGLSTKNAIGALKHFRCTPEPQSLLDALEASGTDNLIQVHRDVSGATGVGESTYFNEKESESDEEGYLLVTGEDTVRGLHLDGLDVVIVVGRPHGPDEYTHIAGRTGRAGRTGSVVNVVSFENASALKSWERMLELKFEPLAMEDIPNLD